MKSLISSALLLLLAVTSLASPLPDGKGQHHQDGHGHDGHNNGHGHNGHDGHNGHNGHDGHNGHHDGHHGHDGDGCDPEPTPWQITDFTAQKGHLSGYCSYSFSVMAPQLASPARCQAYLDAGFSGATWLAYVYPGAGKCDNNMTVTWTFFDSSTEGVDGGFNVTIGPVTGTRVIPAADVKVDLNSEPNPFDTDVYYIGPKNFTITNFVTA